MDENFLSVTQLNEYIRMMMDSNPVLVGLHVKGEISNFTNHYKTGHFYFSLKDETGLIRAVMFRSSAQRVRFVPENGMKVIVHGRVTVFPRDGQYQIYVDDMQPDGIGALYLAFEQLRKRLAAEGLFDPDRKKPIPAYPERIGLVTSPTGAAVRDMIKVLARRFPAARVYLYPALVQGQGAAESVCAGVRFFNRQLPVDVMIVGRGGGSAEDLWAFNDEGLARTVADSAVPVISAVGHETDTTILDFAADLRAPTPSAAAELAVPDRAELCDRLLKRRVMLTERLSGSLRQRRAALDLLSSARSMRSPLGYLEDRRMQVAYLEDRTHRASAGAMPAARASLSAMCGRLESLNPLKVLSRGYAAVFDHENDTVTKSASLVKGQRVTIRFFDGTADAEILGVRESE